MEAPCRGLVRGVSILFILIGLVGVGALVSLGLLLRRGGDDSAGESARLGSGAPAAFKGTGTTWMEDEPAGDATAVVEGVVLDAEGRPVDGARVTRAGPLAGTRGGRPFALPAAGGGRQRRGRTLPDREAGARRVHRFGHPGGRASAHGALAVKERETATVELRLEPGGLP